MTANLVNIASESKQAAENKKNKKETAKASKAKTAINLCNTARKTKKPKIVWNSRPQQQQQQSICVAWKQKKWKTNLSCGQEKEDNQSVQAKKGRKSACVMFCQWK